MTCKEAMRRLEAPKQEAAGSRVDDGEVAATSDVSAATEAPHCTEAPLSTLQPSLP
jgi:hypothetical protein